MTRNPTTAEINRLRLDNLAYGNFLEKVPKSKWPPLPVLMVRPVEMWRSRNFLLQVFFAKDGIERLSVNRTDWDSEKRSYAENITWDELQELKRQCGRGDKDAVEIYPRDKDLVNVSNMRHLWVMPQEIGFKWREKEKS